MWCIGHSQSPRASAASAAPGIASAGPSCGGRGLEGSASPTSPTRGIAGKARPDRGGSWDLVLAGLRWDSPTLLQLVVHRPVNAREDEVRGCQLQPHP